MHNETPNADHHWLQKLVGEWTYESECSMGPDQSPMKMTGKDSVRAIGPFWVQCEGTATMPDGTPGTTQMTLGFDPNKKRYVGSFIGSMMTFFWLYDGGREGDVLTLDAEGPNMAVPGTMAKYQDIIEFKSDDHRVLYAQTLGEDGKWVRFMTAHYRRTK